MEFKWLIDNTHGVVSLIFTTIAIVMMFRTYRGIRHKANYTAIDKRISFFFMVFLYIQCFLGFLLFFVFSDKAQGASSYIEADRQLSLRFWALEHFVVMLFTLILSQIGYIFIIKANSDLNKHKNTMFYYGLSLLLIFVSMSANLIF
jgi:hypothetical protein